jgi:hypothetical protein
MTKQEANNLILALDDNDPDFYSKRDAIVAQYEASKGQGPSSPADYLSKLQKQYKAEMEPGYAENRPEMQRPTPEQVNKRLDAIANVGKVGASLIPITKAIQAAGTGLATGGIELANQLRKDNPDYLQPVIEGGITAGAGLLPMGASAALTAVKPYAAGASSVIARALSGIPTAKIKKYAELPPEIQAMVSKGKEYVSSYAKDIGTNLEKIFKSEAAKVGTMVKPLLEALENTKEAFVSSKPIIDELERIKGLAFKKSTKYKADESGINNIIEMVKRNTDEAGMLSPKAAQSVKESLQKASTYQNPLTGKPMADESFAGMAAKSSAATARRQLEDILPEAAIKANRDASAALTIEGTPVARRLMENPEQLLSGIDNEMKKKSVENLVKAIKDRYGVDLAKEGANLSAAKAFTDADLLSAFGTGRAALAAGAGYGLGDKILGTDKTTSGILAALAGAAGSPYMLGRAIPAIVKGYKGLENPNIARLFGVSGYQLARDKKENPQ